MPLSIFTLSLRVKVYEKTSVVSHIRILII
jgi:hypothetical protein